MSKVYVLTSDDGDCTYTEGVFSSFSALLIWLKETYNYESDFVDDEYGGGRFTLTSKLGGVFTRYELSYSSYDLIGETSHKTDKLVIKPR